MRDLLVRWNPWWEYGKVPESMKRIPRGEQLGGILRVMDARESIILSGVRRSGKSTLMYQLIGSIIERVPAKNVLYFNFDEPLPNKDVKIIEQIFRDFLELNNPKGRKYLFLDEIQAVSGWEQWIKKYYDMEGKDIKFIISGSNSSMLSSDLLKLLTGRVFICKVFPLSFREYLAFRKAVIKSISLQKDEIKHFFLEYLEKGGFPEVVLENEWETNVRRLSEYFDGILLRDIISSRSVREPAKLTELASYLATNISAELSFNKIAKATGININSLREYLNYLEDAYLLFQLRFFSYSMKDSISIQKPRKIYCVDNGMRNAVGFRFSRDEGKLAENAVFVELKKRGSEAYYWRGKGEVDFVVKNKDQSLAAINVSYTSDVKEREIISLLEFKGKFKRTKDLILLSKDLEKNEKGIRFVPLWKWMLSELPGKGKF